MTKFLVLYRSPTTARDQLASATPEQAQAGMEAWMAWAGKAGDAVADLGAPLDEAGTVGGGAPADVSAFPTPEAGRGAAAEELLRDHPHLHTPGGTIAVHEFPPTPGM